MSIQAPSNVFMVRPNHFGYNSQTAHSNAFQHVVKNEKESSIATHAQKEFDAFADILQSHGINTKVFQEENPRTPDAIFPNNWISFHPNGAIMIYPMLAKNRRLERRQDILNYIYDHFEISELIDITHYEKKEIFLEGTGSIIFDHENKIAFANRSPRTSDELFHEVCHKLGFQPFLFNATDRQGIDIYHTNVLMALASNFCVICLESIADSDRPGLTRILSDSGKEILDITYEQLNQFAGNMIELSNDMEEKFMVMSSSAFYSLKKSQLDLISSYCRPIHSDLSTIENYGGGSARCMIASIHLDEKS